MATNNRATLINMQGKLMAMGGVAVAVIGEPKSAVQDGLVSIIPMSGSIDETTLQSPREIHLVMLRRYVNAMREPGEEIEFEMDAWRADVMEDILGDFDLGGNVAYAEPTQFIWNYGFQTIENTIYRLLDLTVAYRIDDRATFAGSGTTAVAYSPTCKLTAPILNATQTALLYTSTGDPITKWDIIQIDTEKLVVIDVNVIATALTIGRGYDSTAATHLINAPILKWGSL